MDTETETCMYVHVKACAERDRNGAVAEILQGTHLGSNHIGTVKLGGFSQSCICIASILFLLIFYGFRGEDDDENSAGRFKAFKATSWIHSAMPADNPLNSMSPPKYYFQIPFLFCFLRTLCSRFSHPPSWPYRVKIKSEVKGS